MKVYSGILLGWFMMQYLLAQTGDSLRIVFPPSVLDLQQQTDSLAGIHARVLSSAMAVGDYSTAIVALHYMTLEDPLNISLKKELLKLYGQTGQHSVAVAYGNSLKTLLKSPDAEVLRLMAESYQGLGIFEPALEAYRDADKVLPDPYLRYQVAGLQFQLARYAECRQTIESLLAVTGVHDVIILVRSENLEQEVYLDAALYNLKGNLELKQGNKPAARVAFETALDIQPAFVLAKQNLESLKSSKK